MKKVYWFLAMVGVMLTPLAHKFETARRGYSAIGGEFLIIPLLLLVSLLIGQMYEITTIVIKGNERGE